MDPSFFGLDGHPFDNSSEHEETYLADTHASLIAELRAGLKAPHGITLLIGEEGTGKTKLIRQFSEDLADGCTVAYLPTTGPGLRHLLTEIIEQLGGSPPTAGDEQTLLDTLAGLARARAQHGRSTLVVVDDAHELPAKTIERIGRLFGEDPADPSMLHVVLVGRPELLDRMNAANDRSILKHLVQVCRMDPIGPEESFRYIADRIARVGGVVDKLFTQDALRLIVKKANGNPGRIDAICSAALQQAAEIGESAVGAEMVDLACMGVEGFSTEGSHGKRDGGDPMQYIFGDEDEEHGGSNVQRRTPSPARGSKDSTDGKVRKDETSQSAAGGALAPLIGKVREQLAGLDESRRRLLVWAVGLVAVLIGFVAVTSRTGQQAVPIAAEEAAKVAAGAKKTPQTKDAAQAEQQEGTAEPLNSGAVRTSKLVVNRDGSASPDTQPPAASEPGAQKPDAAAAPGSQVPSPPEVKVSEKAVEDRPHIQAPPYTAPAATTAPGAPLAGAAPTAAVEAAAKAGPAPQTPPAPTQLAAAQPAGTPANGQQSAAGAAAPSKAPPTPQSKPVETAAAPVPKPAVTTAKAEAGKHLAATQAAAGARYTVQVGAFKSRENAEALLARVQKSYPDGRIIAPEGSGAAAVFRVVSGAFPSRADAESRARVLGATGYTAYVRDVPR